MRKNSILLLLICLSCIPGKLSAQDKFGFEIGGLGGVVFGKARNFTIGPPQAEPPISLQLKYDDKVFGGVRFNLLSRGHWGGEFSYGYQKNKVTLTRQDAALEPVSLDGSVQQFFYNTIFYIFRYDRSPVMPFVTGGIGLEAYGLSDKARAFARDPEQGGIGELKGIDNRFAFNYGVGIKAKLASHFGVRVDFRHIFSDVPSYGLPKESPNPTQTILPAQGKLQNYEASVGIYYHVSSRLGN